MKRSLANSPHVILLVELTSVWPCDDQQTLKLAF